MLHKDIYICCMENCNILYVAVILYVRMWIEMTRILAMWDMALVILYVRMWLEILLSLCRRKIKAVILYVRMWIEMSNILYVIVHIYVILYVRMWIEIITFASEGTRVTCHPLCEDVD